MSSLSRHPSTQKAVITELQKDDLPHPDAPIKAMFRALPPFFTIFWNSSTALSLFISNESSIFLPFVSMKSSSSLFSWVILLNSVEKYIVLLFCRPMLWATFVLSLIFYSKFHTVSGFCLLIDDIYSLSMHTISTLSNGTKQKKRSPTPNPNPHIWTNCILCINDRKAANGTCDLNSTNDFEIHVLHIHNTKIIHTMNYLRKQLKGPFRVFPPSSIPTSSASSSVCFLFKSS